MSLVLTGAGGQLGRVLRPRLLARGIPLRAVDISPITPVDPRETIVIGDLRDAGVVDEALEGATAVLHLAGTSVERPLPEIIENNLVALHALYEGARRHGVQRVVFASSNHTIGMYPAGQKLRLSDPYRPDGFYGISKIWGEAIGRLYRDKYGIEGVALRIGSALPRPTEPRHLATWLGDDDLEQLVVQSLTAPISGYQPVWGVSANTRGWWDNGEAAELGYQPSQNAEDFAAEIMKTGGRDWVFQGGSFAED
ncbi:NAD(P)-dependent oxidoreductase [Acidiphilium acidophilum]|uniref:NAD-dependent epimerase/dehydratase family protein n=1 Tax=Acidiphilium acidophilum TaxID=76588 RepID=UPI002E8E6ADF|nr:NAD(P)-dependent oxidoreductase [Acidiphilium acidophilum]